MSTIRSSDIGLARRIEALEAAGGLAAARSMGPPAAAEPHLGGYAVFGGVESPMTHALGIGMQGPVSEAGFAAMERFFFDRGSPALIDLCPMAHDSVQEFVRSRGYRIIEFNNVMARGLDQDLPPLSGVVIRAIAREETAMWGRLILEGFSEIQPVADEAAAMLIDSCREYECFVASLDGVLAGGAAMNIHQGAAAFFGDATLRSFRGRGVQSALIAHRARLARDAGCDLAVACVLPGSGSHRNYERLGFELVYMRVNVMRAA